jgi:DNA-binding transcriptional ArsR family regulator
MSQSKDEIAEVNDQLFGEIRHLIDESRQRAAVAVNAELTMLYWDVGHAIKQNVIGEERAEYGQRIIVTLARRLTAEYGQKWGPSTLRHCLRAVETFPDRQIVYALRTQLSWTHLRKLIFIEDTLKREFYTEMARLEGWSTRQLNERIKSMLYERTAISKKPEQTIENDLTELRDAGKVSTDLAFRDPYVLDFLGLADRRSG